MNLKSYRKNSEVKKKLSNITIRILAFIFKPLFLVSEKYNQSEFKRKIESKKASKEMFSKIYNDLNRFKKAELYFTPEYINEDDWKINIVSTRCSDIYRFHNVKYYNKWDENRLFKELISHFTLDREIQTETLSLRDLKEYRYWGSDKELDSIVCKISVRRNQCGI